MARLSYLFSPAHVKIAPNDDVGFHGVLMIRFNQVRNSPLKAAFPSRLQRAALASCAALTLTACATTPEPVIRIVETLVPVPVSCVPDDFPPAPDYPDEEQAQDRAEWLALVLSGDALRRDRLADVEAVIQGCR